METASAIREERKEAEGTVKKNMFEIVNNHGILNA